MLGPSNFRWKNEHDDDNKAILEPPRSGSQSPGNHNKSLRPATRTGLIHLVLLATQTQAHCCDSSSLRAHGRDRSAQQIRNPACQGTDYAVRPMATNCTLVLGTGIRLEMPALPDPQWLTALARCVHGGR